MQPEPILVLADTSSHQPLRRQLQTSTSRNPALAAALRRGRPAARRAASDRRRPSSLRGCRRARRGARRPGSDHVAGRADRRRRLAALPDAPCVREPTRARARQSRRVVRLSRRRARAAERAWLRARSGHQVQPRRRRDRPRRRRRARRRAGRPLSASTGSATRNGSRKLSLQSTKALRTPRSSSARRGSKTCSPWLGAASRCRRRAPTSSRSRCRASSSIP